MNYLITAAGKGSRFIESGIKPPKPLIKVLGNELLIWSLKSFSFNSSDKLFIVTYKKHEVKNRLEKKIKAIYPYLKVFWLELEEITSGQLITATRAISYFKIEGNLIIHNCDTSYDSQKYDMNSLLTKEDIFGIIPCFYAEGNHWSFAKTKHINSNEVIEVREKNKISDNCSVGTYIFSSCKDFIELVEEYLSSFLLKNESEFYIAPFYQYAIERKKKVKILNVNNVKVFGTVKELLSSFKISFDELLGENAWDAHQIKTLIVDIDKTICDRKNNQDYSEASPIKDVCEALIQANKKGYYIILFTSRNMRTFKGSMGLINKVTAPKLIKWLSENNIPYDEIYFGKPWGNSVSYIDDKNLEIENLIKNSKNNNL